jgi:hypothetical protein
VRRGAALTGALLVTLGTPATWPLALAAFLLRGGFLVVAFPIVALPTTVELGNVLAPNLSSVALGSVSVELAIVTGAIGLAVVAWLVVGGWLAAAMEAEGARIVARDEDVAASRPGSVDGAVSPRVGDGRVATRILAARLIVYLPLAVALSWGSIRLVVTAYVELTSPLEVATPIVLRVVRASPEVIIAILVAWTLGEIVGAAAARRITLAGEGVVAGLRSALAITVRRPLTALVRFWLPTAALLLVLLPTGLAAGSGWEAATDAIGRRQEPIAVALAVVAFVGSWVVGLLLVGVVCAWRAAAWTVAEVAREGTFGVSPDRRPGDWRPEGTSATL